MIQRKKEMMLKEQETTHSKPVEEAPKAETCCPKQTQAKSKALCHQAPQVSPERMEDHY